MKSMLAALAFCSVLAAPAFSAVNKDGDQPTVNPCGAGTDACAGDPMASAEEPVTEPQIIFLDAEGKTLVRMPLSKFRVAEPDAKLPPNVDHMHTP